MLDEIDLEKETPQGVRRPSGTERKAFSWLETAARSRE
jgi:hypothetical protein